jgi:hypothetical protein
MSKVDIGTRAPAFFELYSRGEVSADAIDDFVERWHDDTAPGAANVPLHEYLGFTHAEYEVWLCDPAALPRILFARQSDRSLESVMAERLGEMRLAGKPTEETSRYAPSKWLKTRTR